MRVWITKYALTTGIQVVDAEVGAEGRMVSWKSSPDAYTTSFAHVEGRDWHRTELAAIERAIVMRRDKIRSLQRSIVKLEKLTFKTRSGDV